MRLRMIRHLCVIIFSVLAGNAFSTGIPEIVELTSDNAERLGFELTEVNSGDDKVRMVVFKFPKNVHGDWVATRVQTALMDKSGDEITGSSSDYVVTDVEPSVLAHYQPGSHDLAIMVQYFCKQGGGYGCSEAYSVSSVTNYLITSAGTTARKRAGTPCCRR